jgi:alkylation response protein AidB-like acyl-CoA dehydrogenase
VDVLSRRALVVARGPPLPRHVPTTGGSGGGGDGVGGLFRLSARCLQLRARVVDFVHRRVLPAEALFISHGADPATKWKIPQLMEELKAEAKAAGLWNFWIPDDLRTRLIALNEGFPPELLGHGLTNLEYAPICEETVSLQSTSTRIKPLTD